MQHKHLIIASAILLAGFSSCKKNDPASAVTEQPRVAILNERLLMAANDTYNTWTFQYNSDKTLKTANVNGGIQAYSYSPGQVVNKMTINGKKTGDFTYTVNNGVAQSKTTVAYDANENVKDNFLTEYKYNAAGKLIRENYFQNGAAKGHVEIQYDANGDMSKYESFDANGALLGQTLYEYDLATEDKTYSYGQFNSNAEGSMFPKKATHLVKKTSSVLTGKVYTYSYEFDNKGYVTKFTMKDGNGVVVDVRNYTWQ